MNSPTNKPNFFARYSKPIVRPIAEPAKPVASPPATELPLVAQPDSTKRRYFYGLPSGLNYSAKIVLNEMDRIGAPVHRGELCRRLCMCATTLNVALWELQQRELVEAIYDCWPILYVTLDPPADCVFPRTAREADAMECLSGDELADELNHEPAHDVDEPSPLRVEAARQAAERTANEAAVVEAMRVAGIVSGVAAMRRSMTTPMPYKLASKTFRRLLKSGTIIEHRTRLDRLRGRIGYTLADTQAASDATAAASTVVNLSEPWPMDRAVPLGTVLDRQWLVLAGKHRMATAS